MPSPNSPKGASATSSVCPVEVIDSAQGSMGLGLRVLPKAWQLLRVTTSSRGVGRAYLRITYRKGQR